MQDQELEKQIGIGRNLRDALEDPLIEETLEEVYGANAVLEGIKKKRNVAGVIQQMVNLLQGDKTALFIIFKAMLDYTCAIEDKLISLRKTHCWHSFPDETPPADVEVLICGTHAHTDTDTHTHTANYFNVAEYDGEGSWYDKIGDSLPVKVEHWRYLDAPVSAEDEGE